MRWGRWERWATWRTPSGTDAPTAPTAPSNLSVGSATTSALTLTWTDNSSSEAGVEVESSANGSTGWTNIATTAANATSYQNTGLTDGVTYYYRVRAVNAAGNSSYTSTANGTTVAFADPGTFEYWQAGELVAAAMKAGTSASTFEYWQNGELI